MFINFSAEPFKLWVFCHLDVCAPYCPVFLAAVVWCKEIRTELVCQTKAAEVFLAQSLSWKVSKSGIQTSTPGVWLTP